MPTPSCLVCFGKSSVPYLTLNVSAGKIVYFRCPQCSLIFQDPGVSFKEEDIYNAEYIQKRSQDPGNLTITRPREKTAQHYYSWVEKFAAKGDLLEIGCATGLALKVAQNRGWNTFGVEVNGEAARIANQVLKADVVRTGFLNQAMFPGKAFSLVALFDVIEHIPNPIEFMTVINKMTAPGGHVLFVTPSVETLSFKLLKEKWPHFVQEHLLFFSPKSMEKLLAATGFKLVKHGWARKYISTGMLKTHADHHPNGLYKSISWILGKNPLPQAVFPFNVGEMYVLAEKIS